MSRAYPKASADFSHEGGRLGDVAGHFLPEVLSPGLVREDLVHQLQVLVDLELRDHHFVVVRHFEVAVGDHRHRECPLQEEYVRPQVCLLLSALGLRLHDIFGQRGQAVDHYDFLLFFVEREDDAHDLDVVRQEAFCDFCLGRGYLVNGGEVLSFGVCVDEDFVLLEDFEDVEELLDEGDVGEEVADALLLHEAVLERLEQPEQDELLRGVDFASLFGHQALQNASDRVEEAAQVAVLQGVERQLFGGEELDGDVCEVGGGGVGSRLRQQDVVQEVEVVDEVHGEGSFEVVVHEQADHELVQRESERAFRVIGELLVVAQDQLQAGRRHFGGFGLQPADAVEHRGVVEHPDSAFRGEVEVGDHYFADDRCDRGVERAELREHFEHFDEQKLGPGALHFLPPDFYELENEEEGLLDHFRECLFVGGRENLVFGDEAGVVAAVPFGVPGLGVSAVAHAADVLLEEYSRSPRSTCALCGRTSRSKTSR